MRKQRQKNKSALRMKRSRFFIGVFVFTFLLQSKSEAQRLMESLNRGVVAVRSAEGKVFVSWRLLGTEPINLSFNLYRTLNGKTEKLNKEPILETTNYLDENTDTA